MAFPVFLVGNMLFLILWSFLRKRYFLISAVCLLLGWNAFQGFFGLHPTNSTSGNTKEKLSILTYNLHHLARMKQTKGIPHKHYNYKKIKEVLLDLNADVLGLQEITSRVFERINDSLAYPYNFSLPDNNTQIVSRYPITEGGGKLFEKSGNSYLWADIKSPQGIFRLINIHLQSNRVSTQTDKVFSNEFPAPGSWKNIRGILSNVKNRTNQRVDQARELQEFMDQSPHPIILCGDFNEAPQSYIYKMLTQNLSDCFKPSGWGIGTTYAGNIPGLRIDYILADDSSFDLLKTEVLELEFSDHYPVKSFLKWK